MNLKLYFKNQLQQVQASGFASFALELFRYQARHNLLYGRYLSHRRIEIDEVNTLEQIPFLPISFYKNHAVTTGQFEPEVIFLSSGTTQTSRSRHLVSDVGLYLHNAVRIFTSFYGPLSNFVFIALLPSYQEQGSSSLIWMVEHFMRESGQAAPYFFQKNEPGLYAAVAGARRANRQVILIGVTYALLDLAAMTTPAEREQLQEAIFMETGGMKGRRQEMIREDVHAQLTAAFNTSAIHSEYGMTELLSQAYSFGHGLFIPPTTMRVLLRDPNDPLEVQGDRRSGGINVIDLANIDSCAFIETQDLGRLHPNGTFEVLGRLDNSDIRGCSLLLA